MPYDTICILEYEREQKKSKPELCISESWNLYIHAWISDSKKYHEIKQSIDLMDCDPKLDDPEIQVIADGICAEEDDRILQDVINNFKE